MLSIIIGLSISAIASTIIWFYIHSTYWRRNGVKGPKYFEGTHMYTKNMRDLCRQWADKYGYIVGYYEMFSRCLQISDPNLLHDILVKDFDKFSERRYYFLGEIFEDCIVMKRGVDWRKVRSVLSPAFSSSKSKQMLSSMPELLDNFFRGIRECSKSGKSFDMKGNIESLIIDATMSTAFNIKTDNFHEPNHPIVEAAKQFVSSSLTLSQIISFLSPKLGKLLKLRPVPRETCLFFKDLYRNIVEKNNAKSDVKSKPDLIRNINDINDTLKANLKEFPEGLTENEVIAQIILLILVGNDAMSCVLYHCFFYLAQNPDIQTRLFDEISSLAEVDLDSLQNTEYLNAFIDEVLRIDPPVIRFDRECNEDYKLGDTGIIVPKGALITISPHTIQRDPKYFKDPDQFRPERFLKDSPEKINALTYLPFGDGPRMCLAVQYAKHKLRIIIAKTLIEFKFHLSEDYLKLQYYTGTAVNVPRHLMISAEERRKLF